MSVKLYHTKLSPPSRIVRILIKHLGINVEEKEINLMTGEHLKPEFTSINPFHVVPTLVDGDFALWESRAIMTYLVDKFTTGSFLYPTDLKARALVNRWLFWDAGTLAATLSTYYGSAFRGHSPAPEVGELFKNKVKDLDSSLEKTKYLTGNSLTIADISISVSITLASAIGIDLNEFKNVNRWMKQLETDLTPSVWSNLNIEPSQAFGEFIKSKMLK